MQLVVLMSRTAAKQKSISSTLTVEAVPGVLEQLQTQHIRQDMHSALAISLLREKNVHILQCGFFVLLRDKKVPMTLFNAGNFLRCV